MGFLFASLLASFAFFNMSLWYSPDDSDYTSWFCILTISFLCFKWALLLSNSFSEETDLFLRVISSIFLMIVMYEAVLDTDRTHNMKRNLKPFITRNDLVPRKDFTFCTTVWTFEGPVYLAWKYLIWEKMKKN